MSKRRKVRRAVEGARHGRTLRFENLEGRLMMTGISSSLSMGGVLADSLGRPAEVDYFTFSGQQGEVVQLVVARTSGNSNFKPYISVYAPNSPSTPMSQFWYDQDKQFTLPRTGTYLVRIQDDNLQDTGHYRVGLEKVNPPSPRPIALPVGGTIERRITQSLQKDQFVFQGRQGEVVQLVAARTSGDANFKPYIKVYAPNNNGTSMSQFWFDQDRQFTLPRDGMYLVQVQDDNLRDLGSYKLGLEKVNPPSPGAIVLPVGGTIERRIIQSLQKDQFVFQGRQGEVVQLVAARTSGDANFKPYIKVYAPNNNGTLMSAFWINQDKQFTLPRTGTYLVQVQDDNLRDLGSYKLGLEKINPASPNPVILRPGVTLQGRIGESLQKDQFVFNGRAGQNVELLVTRTSGSANFRPYVKVYAPSNPGVPISEFWFNQTRRFKLPATGTYLIQIQDDNLTDLGNYQIKLR
jgi:uncharacterized protein YdeI (BOF family)